MAIVDQDGLIAARAAKRQGFTYARGSIANQTAGGLCSFYRAAGGPPVQPPIPGTTFALCDKSLTFNFANPTAPDKTWLDQIGASSSAPGTLAHYDRLGHNGGLSGAVTTAQAVNSQAVLTWPARGGAAVAAEIEWFLEVYADLGATATTANVAVTYSDATTGTVSVAIPATLRAGRLLPIVPAQGKAIASVQTATLAATTGTAGSFGVTCGDRIADATLYLSAANIGAKERAVLAGVPDNACVWQTYVCNGTSTGDLRGEFTLIQG